MLNHLEVREQRSGKHWRGRSLYGLWHPLHLHAVAPRSLNLHVLSQPVRRDPLCVPRAHDVANSSSGEASSLRIRLTIFYLTNNGKGRTLGQNCIARRSHDRIQSKGPTSNCSSNPHRVARRRIHGGVMAHTKTFLEPPLVGGDTNLNYLASLCALSPRTTKASVLSATPCDSDPWSPPPCSVGSPSRPTHHRA